MVLSTLVIKDSPGKGRGVFATTDIGPGVMIEESPVIVMTRGERVLLDQTLLHDYIFEWGDLKDRCCMALGYIPVYNHASPSNCEYEMDYEADKIRIYTMRHIDAGEELLINYNGDWDNTEPVWFTAK